MRRNLKASQLVPDGFLVDHLDIGAYRISLIARSAAPPQGVDRPSTVLGSWRGRSPTDPQRRKRKRSKPVRAGTPAAPFTRALPGGHALQP